jgi:hypothetical protein
MLKAKFDVQNGSFTSFSVKFIKKNVKYKEKVVRNMTFAARKKAVERVSFDGFFLKKRLGG